MRVSPMPSLLIPHPHTIMASVGGVEQSPPPDNESDVLPLHYTSGKAHGELVGLVGSEVLVVLRQPRIRVWRGLTCMTTCDGSNSGIATNCHEIWSIGRK